MKRIAALLLALTLVLGLTACKSKEAKAVEELIANLGEISLDSGSAIAEAEAQFDALPDDQKEKVEGAELLRSARVQFNALCVEDLIKQIGTVTLESQAAIEAAQTAYDELTQEEKDLIANHGTLVDAAATLAELQIAQREFDNNVITGKIDEDGIAYLPLPDGSILELDEEEMVSLRMTKSREYIFGLQKDGTLFYAPVSDPDAQTVISDEVASIAIYRSAGLFYYNGDDELFRYTFADQNELALGRCTLSVNSYSLSALLRNKDGDLLILPESAAEPEEIGSCGIEVSLNGVSIDGGMAVWTEEPKDNKSTIYLYADGEVTELETYEEDRYGTYTTYSADGSFACIYNTDISNVYLKYAGQELVTCKLGSNASFTTIYTERTTLSQDTAARIDGVYLFAETDEGSNLYYVDSQGERERVVSNIISVHIRNGRIYYKTYENDLYCAQISGFQLSGEEKIASEVCLYKVTPDASAVFYMKDVDESCSGNLYYWLADTASGEKMASDVHSWYYSYLKSWLGSFYVGTDNRTVYYYTDAELDVFDYSDVGTLMVHTIGGEAEKIASDIIVGDVSSGLVSYIDPTNVVFEKFLSDEDDEAIINWVRYNGVETETMAKEVYESYSASTDVAEATEETKD